MLPKSRAKSCDNCRVAKARCSQSTAPCLRCTKRRLECRYASAIPCHPKRPWPEGLRPIKPITAAASTVKGPQSGDGLQSNRGRAVGKMRGSVGPAVLAEASSNINMELDESMFLDNVAPMEMGTSTQVSDMLIYSDFTPQLFDVIATTETGTSTQISDMATCSTLTPQSFGMRRPFDFSVAIASASQSLETSGDFLVDPCFVDLSPFSSLLNLNQPRLIVTPGLTNPPEITNDYRPNLSQRVRSFDQGSLTAKMLFSQLTDYTRMIADGKQLPPFIHPPCSLDHDNECPPDTPHHCLPETLAICTNLTQMFYSRTRGSHNFVWQQIYTHLHQMYAEYNSYDEQRLLQALQASIIYSLLCSQCIESVSAENAAWLVSITEMFVRRLYIMCSRGLDVTHLCLPRSQWVLRESLNRIGCLLYLVDLVLHLDGHTPSKGKCSEFFDLPLPCARELWQPISDRDWKKRYEEDVSLKKLKGRRGLTMGNLFLLRSSLIHGNSSYIAGKPGLADEFAEWVERVDGFSMLLWMSFTLEGQGQVRLLQDLLLDT